ncbi:MAG: branched-chain amino acid ABC transporter permease [Bacillota bacterium]|nr:branched-chain amino acid ABC transporter permease [Bacillota bacterium]MDW7683408.1 branched-chain amino acid ABC transporter permease [Bacillota bacterium]
MLKNQPWLKQALVLLAAVLIGAVLQSLITSKVFSGYQNIVILYMCIFIIAAVSLNLVVGITGQFSLGHAGFMALGGYFSAIITKTGLFGLTETIPIPSGLLFLLGLLVGGIIAAIAGFIIGLPTLRLRGDYLAIATLGFGEIIRILFLNWKYVGQAAGYSGITRHTTITWALVLVVITVIIIRNFINSSHGRACISIRDDEVAAEAMGIDTTKYKVTAFVIGAFFAGISGAMLTHLMRVAQPMMFSFMISVEVLLMVVLGGLGSITGSIAAAVFLVLLSEWFRNFSELRMVIYSFMLICVMLFRPKGLLGSREISLQLLRESIDSLRDFPNQLRKRFSKDADRQKEVG